MEINGERFSQKESAAIRSVLMEKSKSRNAAVFSQGILDVCKTFKKWNLQEIEMILREANIGIYLIAVPISEIADCDAVAPKKGSPEFQFDLQNKLPFYLWIGVNASKEAADKMREVGISYNDNFERLSQTGMLVARKGTTIARQANARNN